MGFRPSARWTFDRSISRVAYLSAGVSLFLLKFAIDWSVARFGFGREWSPISYLVWPDFNNLRLDQLPRDERIFSVTLLAISLPFIWMGVALTWQRLTSIGLPRLLVVLFFVPFLNLLFFAILCLLPAKPREEEEVTITLYEPPRRLRRAARRVTGDNPVLSALLAIVLSALLTVGLIAFGATVMQTYGYAVFVGSPFFLGMTASAFHGLQRPRSLAECLGVATVATVLAGSSIFFFAIEGLICLLMAAPIAFFLSMFGAAIGYLIQARPWLTDESEYYCGGLAVLLAVIIPIEAANEPEPRLRSVTTVVEIDAPPEVVWQHVVAFPPLPEPECGLFTAGIAYPQRAEIHGSGEGAVRHCVFNTGTFVEPIEVWDEPNLLRFSVTEQPCPMEEWSWTHIHPPHLDHYLVSERGQFRLEELPDGRTRLEGTTWYRNRMWPEAYWGRWSDHIIGEIHGRVLDHIADLSS